MSDAMTPRRDPWRGSGRLDAAATPAEAAAAIARLAERLMPDRRDPERFHAEKSALSAAARALARTLGRITTDAA